jgi:acyl carrier protein
MDIKDTVTTFIETHLKGRKLRNRYDASLLEEGIIDSVAVIEMVTFLEEAFGIIVEDEEIVPDNLDSVNKIEAYINKKLKEK